MSRGGQSYLSGWHLRVLMMSVVLSVAGYVAFSLWGGWRDVQQAILKVGLLGTLIALLMSCVNYGLRFIRWQGFLVALGHPVPWWPSLRIYLAGFALTTTPGKAGEALRGVLLKRWGMPYPKSFAAFISERLSDLLAVVLLALPGLSVYPETRLLTVIAVILVVAVFFVISQRKLLQYFQCLLSESGGGLARLIHHLLQVLLEAGCCHRPGLLLSASVLSVVAWSAEALAFHWIMQWVGFELSLEFSFFIYAISMLAGALSFMPGGLGGAEAVMVALLLWQGVPSADAIAATLLIRLATLWFAVLIGLGVFTCFKISSKSEI